MQRRGVFQIHISVSALNFSNNTSAQVRVNIRETEHYTAFEIS